jgi:hypothetical protein
MPKKSVQINLTSAAEQAMEKVSPSEVSGKKRSQRLKPALILHLLCRD